MRTRRLLAVCTIAAFVFVLRNVLIPRNVSKSLKNDIVLSTNVSLMSQALESAPAAYTSASEIETNGNPIVNLTHPPLNSPALGSALDANTSASEIKADANPMVNLTHPPLDQLLNGTNIIGNVSSMLDFAIVGFPKCGTSTMMTYLNTDELWVHPIEQCWLGWDRSSLIVELLHEKSPPANNIKKGIKCPRGLEDPFSPINFKKYFYNTNFIIGLRHPVRWFESFYNFRMGTMRQNITTTEMIGPCRMRFTPVCTDRARFHFFLSRLGKTALSQEEMKLINITKNVRKVVPTQVKIFLYDVEQLGDKNETRAAKFRDDLHQFLGIKKPLPTMIHVKPEKRWKAEQQAIVDSMKINICDKQHKQVREVLMQHGRGASRWIRDFFLKSEDVVVSSRYFFEEILRRWEHDPCDMIDESY